MATKKIKRFESGGVSDKDRGLEASKDDKVGFFERMRMGNIDEEGSEAYNRFGAGRAKADRDAASEAAAMRAVDASRAAPAASAASAASPAAAENKTQDNSGAFYEAGSGVVNGTKPDMPVNRSRVNVQATKPSASASGNPRDLEARMGRGTRPQNPRDLEAKNSRGMKGEGPPRTTVGRTAATPGNIPGGRGDYVPVTGEKVEPMSDAERNLQNILMGTGAGAGAVSMLYKGKKMLDARKAVQAGAKKRAELKRATEEGIDRNLADEFKDLASSTAKTPAKKTNATSKNSSYGSAREDAKADKAYKNLRDSDFTRSPRDDKTLNPMAWMSGPKGMADDFKRGGKVKPAVKKMASGGMVSNASKRADGIATKGKTRCKMR